MKHAYCIFLMILFFFGSGITTLLADIPQVSIRDINTYDEPIETMQDLIHHPLNDELIEITAIVSSYPRNSGLATPDFDDPNNTTIGRIHVFVIDTLAYSEGRAGMGLQLVVSGEGLNTLENLERGTIITLRGRVSYYRFGNTYTAQFNTDDIDYVGSVWNDSEFQKYQELLEPWVISLSEINEAGPSGNTARLENYTTYIGQYIKLENAVVINRDLTSNRPWMYIEHDGVIAYNRDTSLRFRNDRTQGYRQGYNFRRLDGEDGLYEPPPPGAVINYSGYVVPNSFDGDNVEDNNNPAMAIVAMEDGVRWLGLGAAATRFTNENLPSGYPYQIPVDLEVIGFPPEVVNYSISNTTPAVTENVEINFTVVPSDDDVEIEKVELEYWANGSSTIVELQGTNGQYSYSFPTFDDLTSVIFEIRVTDSNGIGGVLRDGDPDEDMETQSLRFFVVESEVNSISIISRTSDGNRGPSPLTGLSQVPVNISGVVIADSTDGYIVIHDSNEPWSGVFLYPDETTWPLRRGDRISITSTEVLNTTPANNNFAHVTYLRDPVFEVVEQGVEYEAYIPVVTSLELSNEEDRGAPYEGMVVRVENAYVVTNQADAPNNDFGEWMFASGTPDDDYPGVRVRYNLAQNELRVRAPILLNFNDDIKPGAGIQSVQGVYGYSHGNGKLTMRSENDVVAEDVLFYPSRALPIFMPADGAEITAATHIQIQWAASRERNDKDLTYIFLMTSEGDTDFENPLIKEEATDHETPR
ncbi:hypothetical protein QLX67_02705, partial [Balneolaceae bacterium ANBcel3]|nr:hypothetical protein [Balneolaceae bacterium ANBcel3]